MRDSDELNATQWMEQQLTEAEKERPDLLKWFETGVRPRPEPQRSLQKAKPRDLK